MSTPRPSQILEALFYDGDPLAGLKLAIIGAHPDDEVIGAGAQLPRWHRAQFVHVTDGAPRNMLDASQAGFESRGGYALARRRELEAALSLAGVHSAQLHCFNITDQEASLNLLGITQALTKYLRGTEADIVLTHAYEGGHPDHDAVAFAVHHASRWLRREGCHTPLILEMTSYHNQGGSMVSGEFLPNAVNPGICLHLTAEQRALKSRLFECFSTQKRVLAGFQTRLERFRWAPEYDYRQAPHPGVLYYELFDWGMTGAEWRRLAECAHQELTTHAETETNARRNLVSHRS